MAHQIEQPIGPQVESQAEPQIISLKTAAPSFIRLRAGQFRVLGKSPSAIIGTLIVAFWMFMAIFGPRIAPYDVNASESGAVWKPPSAAHVMGTDGLGRDIFSRLIIAAQPMMILPVLSVGAAVLVGSAIGLFTGYRGGWLDEI